MSETSELLAQVLWRSWHPVPPELDISEEQLASVVPMLIGSGAGSLGWWRVASTPLRDTPSGAQLHDIFRQTALHNAVQELGLIETIESLRSAGLDPILIKGWSVGRMYPDPALRPYGDIDLTIKPKYRARLTEAVHDADIASRVDLEHAWLEKMTDQDWDDLYSRSRFITLHNRQVRVLGPEDQLRFLCFHALFHGVWRPLWLVDIAVALEARSEHFDWGICLGVDPIRANWVRHGLGLAIEILGAERRDMPAVARLDKLPRWVVASVLKQWETPTAIEHPLEEESILSGLKDPRRLPGFVRRRVWNSIRVTVWAEAPFNERYQLLAFQLRNLVSQVRTFIARQRAHREIG